MTGDLPARKPPMSVRLPPELEVRVRAHAAMTGESQNRFVVKALERELEAGEAIAASELIDGALGDFATVTLSVRPHRDGTGESVDVVEDTRRTADPVGRRKPHIPTRKPLTKLVIIEIRREGDRVVIEFRGLPGTHCETARVFVGAVPVGVRATLKIRIPDLHPLSRPSGEE